MLYDLNKLAYPQFSDIQNEESSPSVGGDVDNGGTRSIDPARSEALTIAFRGW